jgi:hypothetical protein
VPKALEKRGPLASNLLVNGGKVKKRRVDITELRWENSTRTKVYYEFSGNGG